MSSERNGINFALEKTSRNFSNQYTSPASEIAGQIEARSDTGAYGQIIEDVALSVIARPEKLSIYHRQRLSEDLQSIIVPLYQAVRSISVPEGKTLSRESVIPLYTKIFDTKRKEIDELIEIVDFIFLYSTTRLHSKFGEIEEAALTQSEKTINTRKCYFLDTLLILSKLTLNGIGEKLDIFGNVIRDIPIREPNNGKVQVTQLDGVFLPKGLRIPMLPTGISREEFIRDLARKDGHLPQEAPQILKIPALLEVKSLFRPRWTIDNLSSIPPYQMREVMQRLGEAYAFGKLAIVPQAIIYLRLRSLANNSIDIFYPNISFYRKWRDAIGERMMEIARENVKDYAHITAEKNLAGFFQFLERQCQISEETYLDRETSPDLPEKARQIRFIKFSS